jgi:hypothetical protein
MSPAVPAGASPLEVLTSPAGALSLATVALLLVLGLRLARPRGAPAWTAAGAYAVALVVTLLGGLGLLPGPALAPPLAARVPGIAAIFAGLLLAGTALRRVAPDAAGTGGAPPLVHLGLVLVLAGQLVRAPSAAGAVAVAAAALAHAVAARTAARVRAGA